MAEVTRSHFHGWIRPGPLPPEGPPLEPGETLDALSGHYRIFQYAEGHRFSTDDVLAAWYGTSWVPRAGRIADLGSGIGSLALVAAWRLPGSSIVTVEAQARSVRLARKSAAWNGVDGRMKIIEGDLRDEAVLAGEPPFDLVLGSPPYRQAGTATEAMHPQAVSARIETRGDVSDYAAAAARILAHGGLFAFVFPWPDRDRALEALQRAGLALLHVRGVVFLEGEAPSIGLFAAIRDGDVPASFRRRLPIEEPPITTRLASGAFHPEYGAIRMSFGFPPGHEPGE